jgi:hypothetical protein
MKLESRWFLAAKYEDFFTHSQNTQEGALREIYADDTDRISILPLDII